MVNRMVIEPAKRARLNETVEITEVGSPGLLDLAAMRAVVWRNRYLALSLIGAGVIAAIVLTLMATRIYTARGSVQIERQVDQVVDRERPSPAAQSDLQTFLQTQVDIIQSRYLAERVVQQLGLARQRDTLKILKIDVDRLPADAVARNNVLASRLQNQLSVDLPRNSQVAIISFDSADPRLSARIANAYLDAFAESNLSRRFESTSYARQFLEGQLAQAQQRLADSERAALAYARSAGLIDTTNAAGATGNAAGAAPLSLTTSDLVQLNAALNGARQNRIDAEQRWQTASRAPLMSLQQVQGNSAVQQLQQQRATAQAQYNELRVRYTANYPLVTQLGAQIAEFDRQINTIARQSLESVRQTYLAAQRSEEQLEQRVNTLRGATLNEQDRSVQYNILRRQAATNRQVYDSLLQRLREVSQEAQLGSNNVTVLDRAVVPSVPSSPRPALNLALGLLVGMLVAATAITLRERTETRVQDPRQVTPWFGVPLLGTIPKAAPGEVPVEQLNMPRSLLSEAYQTLTNTLRLNFRPGGGTVLLVTSSNESEGKTLTSYALALDLSRNDQRVLLVDCDLRRGSLNHLLKIVRGKGLSEVLSGQVDWRSARHAAQFDLITSGTLPADPARLLGSAELVRVLEEAATEYDVVVLDGPPMLGLADAQILAQLTDLTILAMQAAATPRQRMIETLSRLGKTGIKPLGIVLTQFDAKSSGYAYEYGYSYYSYGNRNSDPVA